MAFGSAAVDTSSITIDGVKFNVNRMDNKLRRELVKLQNSQAPAHKKLENERKFVMKSLVNSWEGMTEEWRQKHFVSDETHFASMSCDVDGDAVEIARASFEEMIMKVQSMGEFDYEKSASIAIDDLLMTADAPVMVNGKKKKLNAEIRQQIKRDDRWESSVVDPIWSMAMDYYAFRKGSDHVDLNAEFAFNDANVDKLVGSHEDYAVESNVTRMLKEHANSVDAFKQQQIEKDCEAGKR